MAPRVHFDTHAPPWGCWPPCAQTRPKCSRRFLTELPMLTTSAPKHHEFRSASSKRHGWGLPGSSRTAKSDLNAVNSVFFVISELVRNVSKRHQHGCENE